MNLLILFETFSTNFQDLTQMQLGLHFQLLSNSRMDFGIMEIMEFFPLMHIWFFHHNHLACLDNWFMKCMVKLDIVSVEILTNVISVSVAHVFRKIHVHTLVHVVSASRSLSTYMFLKIVKIDMKTSEPESLFHKVAGLEPAVLLKKDTPLRCFPVNFHTFLKNVFHRTRLGDCFLKFYFRFIMACKWIVRILGQWRIVIHKYRNANQSIKHCQIPCDVADKCWHNFLHIISGFLDSFCINRASLDRETMVRVS